MNAWRNINEVNLYYIKYNIIPNLISFGLAYSYFNKIELNCSLKEYINNVISLFNVYNININDQMKIVDTILITKYKLMILNVEKIQLINIKK